MMDFMFTKLSKDCILQRMMTEKPEKYQHMLQNLVVRAQQVQLLTNRLENPIVISTRSSVLVDCL